MKTNYLFKKTILLLMAVGGVSSVWAADGIVNIPQELGTYIVIGNASGGTDTSAGITIANCEVDNRLGDTTNNKYYTIGSTNSKTTIDFTITPEAGSYVFGFKSGASNNCASVITVSLTKSGEETPTYTKEETITNDGNWDPNIAHNFLLENLEAATYNVHIAVKEVTSGDYAGNFGNFYFHKLSQLTWGSSSSYVELSDGTFTNAQDNSDNVVNNTKREGGSIDNILIYNEEASYRIFHFNIDSYKQASTVKVTVRDFSTGTQEAQETASITAAGYYVLPLSNQITAGLKTVRFDFADADETSDDSYLFNFRYVYFAEPFLPIYGTAVLDLSQGSITSSSNPRYSDSNGTSNEFSYIYNGGSADSYYVYIDGSETAYYDLRTVTSNYNKGGTFKVTITDVATNTVEVNAQESAEITSNNQSIVMALSSALKPGIKKIRFDFVKENESEWLYNIKDICFLKRSLNEGYDYTAVAATSVDVVLTRSISKDNWSTIVLPFAMTSDQISAAFGSDAKVAALTSATADALTFSTVTAMEANKPYAIKVATDFTSATINNVTIIAGTPTQTVGNWNFVGTYENGTIPDGSYYFSSNKLWQASGTGIRMKPFRAYFNSASGAREIKFLIDEDGQTTALGTLRADGSMSTQAEGMFYSISGQHIAKPTKGLYIVNGKKVIIK